MTDMIKTVEYLGASPIEVITNWKPICLAKKQNPLYFGRGVMYQSKEGKKTEISISCIEPERMSMGILIGVVAKKGEEWANGTMRVQHSVAGKLRDDIKLVAGIPAMDF